jgi:hypothetical protein
VALVALVAITYLPRSRSGNSADSGDPHTAVTDSARVAGFGATTSEWNAHHIADPNAGTNLAYNPMPNLPGGYSDEYYAVTRDDGHVDRYEMAFSAISEAAAKHLLLSEFPSDAKIRWFKRLNTCVEMEIHSKALGRALSSRTIGDSAGEGYVELVTGMMPGDGYDPRGVNGAIVSLGSYMTPTAAPAC